MRTAKVLVLVAVAITALASVGASAAMAAETTLCKSSTEAPFCKAENRYPAGTSFKGSAGGETQLITSFGTMKCKSSVVEGSTTAAQGAPLQVGSLQWSLSTCNLGGTACTASAAETTGNLAWTRESEGTFEGKGKWQVACGEAMSCSFAMPRISVVPGISGHLVANEVTVETQGGLACPKSAKLTADYTVSSPKELFLARAEAVPPASTTMCKKLEGYCPAENRYPSGTTIQGTASDFVLKGTGGVFGELNCKETTLSGKTTAESGQPLGAEMTSFVFIGCRLGTTGVSCTVTPQIMKSGGITRSTGLVQVDGIWVVGGTRLFITCTEYMKCTYDVVTGGTVTVEHGNPGTILAGAKMEKIGGEQCPSTTTLYGHFTLSSPSGSLFFTNALP